MSEREKLVEIVREALWRQNFAAHEDAETVQRQKEAWRHEWDRSLTKATDLIAALETAGVRLVPVEATEEMVSAYYDEMPTPYHIDMRDTGEARQAIEHVLAASPYAKEKPE